MLLLLLLSWSCSTLYGEFVFVVVIFVAVDVVVFDLIISYAPW